jgi:hypothetical protein
MTRAAEEPNPSTGRQESMRFEVEMVQCDVCFEEIHLEDAEEDGWVEAKNGDEVDDLCSDCCADAWARVAEREEATA